MLGLSIGSALGAIPYVAITVGALLAYDRWVDDPAIRSAARQGYVTQATVTAIEAELLETKRQWAAAESVAAAWHAQLVKQQDEQAKRDEQVEKDTAEYEAKLDEATRACRRFNPNDLDFLRK